MRQLLSPRGSLTGVAAAPPVEEQVPPWAGGNPLTSMDEFQREAWSDDLVLPLPPAQQRFAEGAPPPLPPGWIIVTSRADGAPYFYNQHTGESCWHVPGPLHVPPPRPGAAGALEPGQLPELADLPTGGALPSGTLRRELLAQQRQRTRATTV